MAKKKVTTATAEYLKPILQAADLLKIRVNPYAVEHITQILEKLSPTYPGSVLEPVHALAMLKNGMMGSVEELEILERLWPDVSGEKRFTLTPTTLTWKWSSKHSGVYATITLPFPTILPMTVTVTRSCDMDNMVNHSDDCQVAGDDESVECNCESFLEQEVSATVEEWDDHTEAALAAWLERAITQEVKPATFKAKVLA